MTKIYISCTTKDFSAMKDDVLSTLHDFPSLEPFQTPAEAAAMGVVQRCLSDVGKCDVYVGLVGFLYGWSPPWPSLNPLNLSMTELEFREATRLGKRRLVFLADLEGWNAGWVDLSGPAQEQVARFRKLILDDESLSSEFFRLEDATRLPMKIINRLEKLGASDSKKGVVENTEEQCPYPGLFSFRYEDRHFYFGRDSEIDLAKNLLDQSDCNFLIVSGGSGTGKSSLVEAGILPRIRPPNVAADNEDWFIRVRPAESPQSPLLGLAHRLTNRLPGRPLPERLVSEWMQDPKRFCQDLYRLGSPSFVIVVDQLEELFTSFSDDVARNQFMDCLSEASRVANPRTGKPTTILASIRSDYRDHCQAVPALNEVLQNRHYIDLFKLSSASVYQMVFEPAEKRGLDVTEVVEELVAETAAQPASLPLLATTLRSLWERRTGNRLTLETLVSLGGINGIISQRADTALARFERKHGSDATDRAFNALFSDIVQINMAGEPVRKRALVSSFHDDETRELAEAFAADDIRLVYFSGGEDRFVEVVHEALFKSWQPLNDWIEARLTNERELSQARFFASDWVKLRAREISRLELVRIHDAHRAMRTFGMTPDQLDDATKSYLFPREFLKSLLEKPIEEVSYQDRVRVGDLLDQVDRFWDGVCDDRPGIGVDELGAPSGGDDYFVLVEKGDVQLEVAPGNVVPQTIDTDFRLGRYPITQGQFKAFFQAPDGYQDRQNWPHLDYTPECHRFPEIGDNRPAVNVAWIEATAYCRWLDRRMKAEGRIKEDAQLRLPTEQEWQLASTSARVMQTSPGVAGDWEIASGDLGITAVGLSPAANSGGGGLLDFSGYIWEWCLNQYENYLETDFSREKVERAVRGGAFLVSEIRERRRFRGSLHMLGRDANIGFRVCISRKNFGF